IGGRSVPAASYPDRLEGGLPTRTMTMHETATRRHHSLATPRLFVVGLVFFAACHHQQPTPAPAPTRPAPERAPSNEISSSASLIRAMHERYPSWYRTISFT